MSAPGRQGSDREFVDRALRYGIIGVTVAAALLLLLWLLKSALTPLALAFVIAYLFDPLIDRFEKRRIGRRLAIFLLLGVFAALSFGFAFAVVPRMQAEVVALAEVMPSYVDGALRGLAPSVERIFGVQLPESLLQGLDELRQREFTLPLDTLRGVLADVVATLTGTVGTLVGLLVVPVIAYYLLADFDALKRRLLNLVPESRRDAVASRASTIDGLLSGFIRGQLLVCLILGFLYAVGFSVIGIQSAVLIGFVSGLLAIIPYVGSAVALASASLMALLQYGLDIHVLLVVGWYVLVQNLEGFVLTPRIVGGSIGLHPVTVIVALLIGGDLLGFLGLLVAVPLAAVVQVFVHDALAAYRRSPLYTD